MKQKIILLLAVFLISYGSVAQDYMRKLNVHSGENVTTYELPRDVDGFQVVEFVYSSEPSGTENGYEYVDLGLPSGVKWATCNIGATQPLEYGNFYSWGELSSDIKVVNDTIRFDWVTYKYSYDGTDTAITKYCTEDGKRILDPEDDVANVEWGGKWRMPTKDDFVELGQYCSFIRGYIDGVYGIAITSTINGATIYAPAAGAYLSNIYIHPTLGITTQNVGAYWSSSLCELTDSEGEKSAYFGSFNDKDISLTGVYRCLGLSVRPVYDPFDPSVNEDNGEYVDLGLPSGIKLGSCNMGATKPYEYGNFYAWGKVAEMQYNENDSTIYLDPTCYPAENRSCDPVTMEKGDGWRMPSKEDVLEIYQYCTFRRGYSNGVYGIYIIGANNNHVFVPAAGVTAFGYSTYEAEMGAYWYSTMDEEDETKTMAYIGGFDSNELILRTLERVVGACIRPIYDPKMLSEE